MAETRRGIEIYVPEQDMVMAEELQAHGMDLSEVFRIGLMEANRREISREVVESSALPAIVTSTAMLKRPPSTKQAPQKQDKKETRSGDLDYEASSGDRRRSKKDFSTYTIKSWMNIKTYKEAMGEVSAEKSLSEVLRSLQEERAAPKAAAGT